MVDRIYYRVQELASRWGCTVDDLIHLGVTGQAQICVNVYGLGTGLSRTRLDLSGPGDYAELTDQERQEAIAHDALIERWESRTTKDMPHGVYELTHETLRFMEMTDPFPHELYEGVKFDGGWWVYDFDPPVKVTAEHLCILHEEMVRMEHEVFLIGGKATPEIAAEKPLLSRERDTLLTIIAVLCKDAGYDFTRHAKTAGLIQSTAAKMGVSIGESTIEGHLKKIPNALGTRMK